MDRWTNKLKGFLPMTLLIDIQTKSGFTWGFTDVHTDKQTHRGHTNKQTHRGRHEVALRIHVSFFVLIFFGRLSQITNMACAPIIILELYEKKNITKINGLS